MSAQAETAPLPVAAGWSRWRQLDGVALLALPAVLAMAAIFAFPVLLLLFSSVRDEAGFSLQGYVRLLGDPYYIGVLGNTLQLATITTLGALLIGYPAAFALARARGYVQVVLFALVFLPLSVSVIVKSFGWGVVLRRDGIVNWFLMHAGFVERPVRLLFTEASLFVGMVNVFLPFMILPIYSVVRMIDPRLSEAAASLGASPRFRFLHVTLPLSLPGLIGGVSLVFALSVSAYVTPSVLIGDRYMTMSMVMAKAFLNLRDWQLGGSMAAVMLAISATVIIVASRLQRRLQR